MSPLWACALAALALTAAVAVWAAGRVARAARGALDALERLRRVDAEVAAAAVGLDDARTGPPGEGSAPGPGR